MIAVWSSAGFVGEGFLQGFLQGFFLTITVWYKRELKTRAVCMATLNA